MALEVSKINDQTVQIAGRLDVATAREFQTVLDTIPDGEITIDCGGLEFVSSAGLRVFLVTQKRLKRKGGGIRVINLSPDVYPAFKISGFNLLFEISTR